MDHIALAKAAIEATYDGICSIYLYGKTVVNNVTKYSVSSTPNIESQPCSLSQSSNSVASQGEVAAEISNTHVLFVSPDISVSAGSKIVVTQNGATYNLSCCGKPFVYDTHQEIPVLEEDYA